jgi:hypothetical protein
MVRDDGTTVPALKDTPMSEALKVGSGLVFSADIVQVALNNIL